MVSHRVFSDVMRIVEFHHKGHLESFAYDRFLQMCRASYLLDRYDFEVAGVQDVDGGTDDDFVPGHVSDPRPLIRLIDPALTEGPTSVHDVSGRISRQYDIAAFALGKEDASRLQFCVDAYQVLLIESGFVLPRAYRRWCDIEQDYVVIPMNVANAGWRYMRRRYEEYVAWVALMRA